jgi:23S rRNA (guanosine2251-2'-O)-methyltransferase
MNPDPPLEFSKLKMHELGRSDLKEYAQKEKWPFVFVLDNIRSLLNVGSIFRTCDGFGAEGLFLIGFTGTPPNRDIAKTALGATESVSWTYFSTVQDCIAELKKLGFSIVAIEQTKNSTPLNEFSFLQNQKYAFILGNEVEGVSDEALQHCDAVLEIPQFGTKHSLNVSVTCGIIAWSFVQAKLEHLKIKD